MTWYFIDAHHIAHSDGHQIHLKDGSWQNPYDLEPSFVCTLSPLDAINLLREGMDFAKTEQPQPQKNNYLRSRATANKNANDATEQNPDAANKKTVKIINKKRRRINLEQIEQI